jgi:hypothetical protein
MLPHTRMPYSQKALEDLAAALNVNSGALWFSPGSNRVEIKAECVQRSPEEEELECEN